MRARTEAWFDAALRRSPAQSVFHWRASRQLAILAYHGVDDPELFAEHLNCIRRRASAVTLAEVLEAIEGRRSLPRRPVLITFDDGPRNILDLALPLLRERGLPAVAFVIAGLINSDRPFWWAGVLDLASRSGKVNGMQRHSPQDLVRMLKRMPDERRRAAIQELRETAAEPPARMHQLTTEDLRALESAGVAIGNHTWSHPSLPRCKPEVRRHEIEESHRVLTEVLGHPPEAFAYPDGQHDPLAAEILRELGYRAAFLFDHRLSEPHPNDPLAVSRLRVNSTTTLDRFHTITSGLHPALHRLRGGA